MTTSAERITAAADIGELVAEADRARLSYGDSALVSATNWCGSSPPTASRWQALQGLDLLVTERELTAMVGASGSGKSDADEHPGRAGHPTAGSVRAVAGRDLASMSALATARLPPPHGRLHLAADLTQPGALSDRQPERELPMRFAVSPQSTGDRAAELLASVGVAHCGDRSRGQMSGGEQQRTRSRPRCANGPRLLLLADSPPANWTARPRETCSARCARPTPGPGHDGPDRDTRHRAVAGQVRRTSRSATAGPAPNPAAGPEPATPEVEYAVLDRTGQAPVAAQR